MNTTLIIPLMLSVIGMVSANAAESNITAPGATPQKLAGDFSFTEGPASDREGNVFFTDQPNDRIIKWSVDGKLSTWMQPSGRANGLYFDSKGNLWACADGKNELWKIESPDKHTVVLKDFEGKLFNGPNDLWIHPNGGIFFTDPYYKRGYWNRGPKEMDQCVYYVHPQSAAIEGKLDHNRVTRIIDDLTQPNGIIGTPDGKTLYVADIGAKKTYRYSIQSDGSVTEKKLFCELGSDGMTLDDQGNVYLTGRGVTVFDKNGTRIEQINIPEGWTANVCFGGPDRQTLFITASKSLYSLKMRVKGAGSH